MGSSGDGLRRGLYHGLHHGTRDGLRRGLRERLNERRGRLIVPPATPNRYATLAAPSEEVRPAVIPAPVR